MRENKKTKKKEKLKNKENRKEGLTINKYH